MRTKKALLFILFPFFALHACKAQTGSAATGNSLIGIWKGTSICQVKNSPCHDEIVVYHISKGEGQDSFNIQANKIVNGVEEDMGLLAFVFDKKKNQLISTSYNSLWTFTLKEAKLEGTLMHGNQLYRIIKLEKQ